MPSKFFVRGLNGQFGGAAAASAPPTKIEFSGVTMDTTTGALDGTNLAPKYVELASEHDTKTPNGLLEKGNKKKIDANRGAQFKSYCENLINDAEQTFKQKDIEEANTNFNEVTAWEKFQQASKKTSEHNYILINNKLKSASVISVTANTTIKATANTAVDTFITTTSSSDYDSKTLKTAIDTVFAAITTYTALLVADKTDYDKNIKPIKEAWDEYVKLVKPPLAGQFQKYSKTKYNSNCGRFMSELEASIREVIAVAYGNQSTLRRVYGLNVSLPFFGLGSMYGGGIVNPFINNKMVGGSAKTGFIYERLSPKVEELWNRAEKNLKDLELETSVSSDLLKQFNAMKAQILAAIKTLKDKEDHVISVTKQIGMLDALVAYKKLSASEKKEVEDEFNNSTLKSTKTLADNATDADLVAAFRKQLESVVRKTGRCLSGIPTVFGALFRT
jgi:hypothetical protein